MAVALRTTKQNKQGGFGSIRPSAPQSPLNPWAGLSMDDMYRIAYTGSKDPAPGHEWIGSGWQQQSKNPMDLPSLGGDGTGGPGATGPGGAPAGAGITGFDPGIAAFGLNAVSSAVPGIPGAIGTGIAQGIGQLGSLGLGSGMSVSGLSAQGIPDNTGVVANNVPDSVVDAVAQGLGLSPATSFTAAVPGINSGLTATPSPDDTVDVTGAVAGMGPAAGYTDPANITANAPGNAPAGGATPTGGSGSSGSGAGPSGGDGSGGPGGEAPHTGGYIAGDNFANLTQQQLSSGDVYLPSRFRKLTEATKFKKLLDEIQQGDQQGFGTGGTGTQTSSTFGSEAFNGGDFFGGIPMHEEMTFNPAPIESIGGGDTGTATGDPSDGGTAGGTGDAAGAPAGDAGAPSGAGDSGGPGAFHAGGYVGGDGLKDDEVMAKLQEGEFVVPRGPMAEMLRAQNPQLTKYGKLLDRSPIKNYMDPRQVAGLPWGLIINEGISLGKKGFKAIQDRQQAPQRPTAPTDDPYLPSPDDAPENGGFPDPSEPRQQNTPPPAEQPEQETPGARREQGMHKLRKIMVEFA